MGVPHLTSPPHGQVIALLHVADAVCGLEVVEPVSATSRERHDVIDRQGERVLDVDVLPDLQAADAADVTIAFQHEGA
jgi:hypothetical protein